MKNKNILVWLLVALAVVGAVAIGYTYRGALLQGKIGPVSGPGSGPVSENKGSINNAINRAEFAKLLALAIEGEDVVNYKCEKEFPLDEQGESYWFAPYICYLSDKGIIKDYSGDLFSGPSNKVNRAEAAQILVKAYSAAGGLYGGLEQPAGNAYKDVLEQAWYYTAVQKGSALKLFDIKPWAGAKFYAGNYLSKGRAELWIDNFKKALGE